MIYGKCLISANGLHYWDEQYSKQYPSERFCTSCKHYFYNEEDSEEAIDDLIDMGPNAILTKKQKNQKPSNSGIKKGIVKRVL